MLLKHNGEYLLPLTEEEVRMLREALKDYRDQVDFSDGATEELLLEKEKRSALLSSVGWDYEY